MEIQSWLSQETCIQTFTFIPPNIIDEKDKGPFVVSVTHNSQATTGGLLPSFIYKFNHSSLMLDLYQTITILGG